MSAGRTGWPAVFGCFCLAIFAWSFGFYGQSVFLAELQRRNGWSASLVSAATTTYYLLGAVALAFVPEVMERLGRRVAIGIGMALLASGAASLPAVHAVGPLYGAQVVMAAGWALTSGTAISAVLAPWFARQRGLAISLALNGASAAGFTAVPALIWLASRIGFGPAVWTMAAALLAVVGPVVAFALRPPSEAWLAGERAGGLAGRPEPDVPEFRPQPASRAAAIQLPRFWLAAIPFGLGLLAQVGFILHQVSFLLPRLGPDGTGAAVALTTVAALLGRLAVAAFVDRLDRRLVTAASFLLQAASLAAMLLAPYPAVLYGGSFLFGLSVGNAITLPALVVMDEFAPAAFGLVLGLTTALNQFTYAFGPLLLGALRDASGSYDLPLVACIALEIAAAALALAGRPGWLMRAAEPDRAT